MKADNLLRRILLQRLPISTYMKWAERYNNLLSPLSERQMKRPVDDYIIDCNLPLIYISQSPRCGGTLLRNLLDSHPQLHVYPYELSWQKNGYEWEEDLQKDAATLSRLKDHWLTNAIRNGVDRRIPFYFNQSIQKRIFLKQEAVTSRDVLGAYMTSFFNAWTNYQGLYGEKEYCAAFCPWNSATKESVDRFFSIYPDGFRIHVIRDPRAWWASEKSYLQPDKSLETFLNSNWMPSVRDGFDRHEERPDRYILINYEQLCLKPEQVLRRLCESLKIRYSTSLLKPTVNRVGRKANTSYQKNRQGSQGISKTSVDSWKNNLNVDEIEVLKCEAIELYSLATNKCIA